MADKDEPDTSGLPSIGDANSLPLPPRATLVQDIPAPPSITGSGEIGPRRPAQTTDPNEPDTAGLPSIDPEAALEVSKDDQIQQKYGTGSQQALTALEGAAQGVLGPLAPLAETATGLTTGKDILGRQTANPWTHIGSEALSFGASSIFGDELGGLSLAGATEGLGKLAAKAIPMAGAKGAAELASLAASHELSRMIEGDPNQTLGSAAVSIGLSGLLGGLGGLGGAILEKTNPLKAYANYKLTKQASGALSHVFGEIGGFGVGHVVGHAIGGLPGAIAGLAADRIAAPIITGLSKPLANKIVGTEAAQAMIDGVNGYINAANAGQTTIINVTKSLFSEAFKDVQLKDVLPPSEESRNKLQAYLLNNETKDINDKVNMGAMIAHWLPEHATEAANVSEKATDYFKQIRPNNAPSAPLDSPGPVRKPDLYNYNRQLDIAQKPLVVVGHIQNGTLMPQDIQTIKTLYPGVHDAIVKNITSGLIEKKDVVKNFSYAKKKAINDFIGGTPLDSTMTPFAAQQIMKSSMSVQPSQAQNSGQPKKASGSELRQIDKTNALYATKPEATEINRRQQ